MPKPIVKKPLSVDDCSSKEFVERLKWHVKVDNNLLVPNGSMMRQGHNSGRFSIFNSQCFRGFDSTFYRPMLVLESFD